MHTFILCEVPEVEATLAQIDERGDSIVSSFYCADSQQVGIITKGKGDMYSAMKRIFEKGEEG